MGFSFFTHASSWCFSKMALRTHADPKRKAANFQQTFRKFIRQICGLTGRNLFGNIWESWLNYFPSPVIRKRIPARWNCQRVSYLPIKLLNANVPFYYTDRFKWNLIFLELFEREFRLQGPESIAYYPRRTIYAVFGALFHFGYHFS